MSLDCAFLRVQGTDLSVAAQFMGALKQQGHASMSILNYDKRGRPFSANVQVRPVFDAVGPDSQVPVITHFASVMSDVHYKALRGNDSSGSSSGSDSSNSVGGGSGSTISSSRSERSNETLVASRSSGRSSRRPNQECTSAANAAADRDRNRDSNSRIGGSEDAACSGGDTDGDTDGADGRRRSGDDGVAVEGTVSQMDVRAALASLLPVVQIDSPVPFLEEGSSAPPWDRRSRSKFFPIRATVAEQVSSSRTSGSSTSS